MLDAVRWDHYFGKMVIPLCHAWMAGALVAGA